MRARVFVPVVAVVGLVALDAAAIDTQACLAASEKGQHARAAGKLREARDQFNICGNDACPAIVRRDCAQWQGEVTSTLPTVVFGAKDKAGKDLFEVTVSMDGEVIAKKLDGKSVAVDPGPHTFKFEMAGMQPVVEKSLVKEGERARVLVVTFDDAGPTPGPGPGPTPPDHGGGHTAFPWILAGVGLVTVVVGVVIVVAAPSRPPNCSKDTETCTRLPQENNDQLQADQDRAGKSDSQPVVGIAVAAVGGVALASGLLWHFLEPTGDSKSGMRVEPWLAPGMSGVSVGARF